MESKDPWNPGPEDLARQEQERQSLWREFGVTVPRWEVESQAPPVDEQLLRQLYAKELDTKSRERVAELIFKYRSWAAAYCRIRLEKRHTES